MKILISADTYYPHLNGASYFTQRLAYYLKAKGHDTRVITVSQSFKNTETIINTVQVYGLRSISVLFYKGFRFCLPYSGRKFTRKIFKEFQPDIVHLQGHFPVSRTVLSIAKKNNIPVVATNHFMPENLVHYVPAPNFIRNLIKKAAWLDFARIFNKVGQVTTPTRTAANFIQKYLKIPVQPISCGIDLKRFNTKNNGDYLKERYKIPTRPILLYVGRLDKEKNLDFVLKAFAVALKQIDFQFVIAGTGAEKKNLIERAENLTILEHVTFTGFVPDNDLPNLYAISDCFMIAGLAELQSIVTMEAMASGLPVIAVNAVALPELIKNNQNGFLFEDSDLDGLTKNLVQMFSDTNLRRRMSAKSLEFITFHDIDKSIDSFLKVYRDEINKNKN